MADDKIEVQFGANTSGLDAGSKKAVTDIQAVAQAAQKSGAQSGSAWAGFGNVFAGVARALNGSMSETKTAADGTASSATAAFSSIASASTQMQAQVGSAMSGAGAAVSKLRGLWAGLATIAAGAMFRSAIKASTEWTGETVKLSKELGISTEKASVLNVALKHLGIDSATYSQGAFMLSRQIRTNADAFEKLGVTVKDSNTGAFKPTTQIMDEVNAKLRAIHNPILQNQAGMLVYGRSWRELRPLLKLNADEMSNAEKRAKELGLVVGPEGAAQARQYKEQMNDLNLITKSLEISLGKMLLPTVVKIGGAMASAAQAMSAKFGAALKEIADFTTRARKELGTFWGTLVGIIGGTTLKMAGIDIDPLKRAETEVHDLFSKRIKLMDEIAKKKQAVADAGNNWQTKAASQADLTRDMEMLKELDAKLKSATRSRNALSKAAADESAKNHPKKGDQDQGEMPDFDKEKKEKTHKDKKDPSEMKEYELELEKLKLAYAEQNEGRELDKATELAFWNTKLQTVKKGSDDETAILKKATQIKLQMLVEAHRQEDAMNKQVVDDAERDALSQLAIQEELAKGELEAGRITKSQLLQQQIAFEKQRLAIELEAEEERKSLLNTKTDQVGISASDSKMADKRRQANLKLVQLDMQLKAQESPIWSAMSNSMSSLWDKGINAMMNGTLRWKNALRATWTEMAGMFAKSVIKPIVANWAKSLSTMIAQKLGFAATEKAIDTTSAATSMATTGAAATVKVGANAASAASGAASALASIPYVGPILAIAAMGAMFAAVTAMGSNVKSASGGYDIPSGLNPVTQLHEEEMVLPKGIANPMRKMLAGGGLGGGQQEAPQVASGDVHYHDYSGRLTKSQIRENAAVIATELNRLHRDGWRPK